VSYDRRKLQKSTHIIVFTRKKDKTKKTICHGAARAQIKGRAQDSTNPVPLGHSKVGRNAIKSTHSFDSYKRLSYELKSQERVNGPSGVRKQSDASSAEQAND